MTRKKQKYSEQEIAILTLGGMIDQLRLLFRENPEKMLQIKLHAFESKHELSAQEMVALAGMHLRNLSVAMVLENDSRIRRAK